MILRSPLQKYFFPCRASTLNTRGRKGVAWFASCLDCLKALKGMYKVLGGKGREGGRDRGVAPSDMWSCKTQFEL